MGHSIVYCDNCGLLLKEVDFQKGKASCQNNRNYCSSCRPVPVAPPPPKPAPPASTTRIKPVVPSSTSRIPRASSGDTKHRMASVREPLAAPLPSKKSPAALYAGIGGAVLLLIVVIAAASGGGARRGARTEEAGTLEISRPEPVKRPTPGIPVAPVGSSRDAAAKDAYARLMTVQNVEPRNLTAQWKAGTEAAEAVRGTAFEADLNQELAKLRRRLSDEVGEVELAARTPRGAEQYRAALDLYEAALKRHALPEWTTPVGKGLEALKAEIEERFKGVCDPAVEARGRGSDVEGKAARVRVVKWGLPEFTARLEVALTTAVGTPEPPPKPEDAAVALRVKEREVYQGRWKAALLRWSPSAPAEAVKALESAAGELKDAELKKEAAADLEDLKLATAFVAEAPALLAKLPKGQKASWTYRDDRGAFVRVEDVLLKADAFRLEVKQGEESVVFPAGELGLATFGELWRQRPAKKEGDARAVALACLLEGDVEGAARFAPLTEAQKALVPAPSEKEQAARDLFRQAEFEYADPETVVEAVTKYRALLGDHGSTGVVTRNRALIAARIEPVKEHVLPVGDLLVSGGWRKGKHGKIEAAWVTQQDIDLAQIKTQFVDLSFAAWPDTDYKAWIFAGGCCLEVFSCYLQASELQGPDPENPKQKVPLEPGSGSGQPVKIPFTSLKKKHSDHTGPKEPDRFEWLPLGTFRFTTPGPKKIRILTNQKGFGAAMACVSATRSGPPSATDLREAERLRLETPGTGQRVPPASGFVYREIFRGIGGTDVAEFLKQPAVLENRPSEAGNVPLIEHEAIADDYGTRYRGYLHPPLTGDYVFKIAGDDRAELLLSSDEDPAKKQRIAFCGDWTNPREYGKTPAQTSQPVRLKAGRRYYIEALHKEGGGGDHISVAWQLPDGKQEQPIPANRYSPFLPVNVKK